MAFTATSPMVVDLSDETDDAGILAAAANIPPASQDSPFERSCDNPECSAPRLISMVPKRETPEFITEPMIKNQPTLINGFTTVFQIDGIGAKMNEIIYGDGCGPSTSGAPARPKSVFRIVPNTHAHIVNYVVVDGAGETMRKIKANDAETMRKLLDSQRLSAEQMLKKLIERSFKAARPPVPVVPSEPVFISKPLPAHSLPNVPPGITITPIPLQEVVNVKKPICPTQSSIVCTPTIVPSPSTSATHETNTISSASKPIAIAPTTTITAPTTQTPNTPILVLRQSSEESPADAAENQTPRVGRACAMKRKLTSTPTTEVIKRLRPRSPKYKYKYKTKTPMAVGLKPISNTAPLPTNKLPTLPKLPTKPTQAIGNPMPQKKNSRTMEVNAASNSIINSPKADADSASKPIVLPTRKLLVAPPKSVTSSSDEVLSGKTKPIMGPASKMNALKAVLAAKAIVAQNNKSDLTGNGTLTSSIRSITRIGETVITSCGPLTSKTDVTALLKTKPCSVAIEKADIPTSTITEENELLSKEATAPKPEAAAASKSNLLPIKVAAGLTSMTDKATTSQSPGQSTQKGAPSKVNMMSIKLPVRRTNEADPLAIDATQTSATPTRVGDIVTTPKICEASTSKVDAAAPIKLTEILPGLMGTRTITKVSPSTQKTVAKTNEVTPKTTSKAEGPVGKVTRSSTPANKLGSASPKPDETLTPSSTSQSRSLRVVLPALKSGIMTIPVKSPHPNLKIASVISGGSAVAAATRRSSTKIVADEISGPDVEKLQQELADLKRTVARLSKRKS